MRNFINRGSHTGKGYDFPEEEPPDHLGVLRAIFTTDHKKVRYHVSDETFNEDYDDDEGREGRNWAILLTLFAVILVQVAGVVLIAWAVF